MPLVQHDHVPLFRVARRGWTDPLDTTFAQQQSNRWNFVGGLAVLYTCCSVEVARAVVTDIFSFSALTLNDLRPEMRPVLVEVFWRGAAIDLASVEGLVEAGFPLNYPEGVEYSVTQPFAEAWSKLGAEAILCRSASVWRQGHRGWMGSHEPWSELAILTGTAKNSPRTGPIRETEEWLDG